MDLLPLTGTRVGLIGNGSSGIQLLPELQRPTWVIPEMRYKQRRYTDEEKQTLRDNLRKLLQLRKDIEANYTTLLPLFLKDTYEFPGKPHEAQRKSLSLEISRNITPSGDIMLDGSEYAFYVLVWAQASRPAFDLHFHLTGRNDTNLAEPLANSPLIICIEAQEHYIAKFLNRWQKEDIRTFEPKLEAVDDFMEQKDLFMKSTIWENDCRSWFKKRQHRQGQWIVAWERAKLYRSVAVQRFEDFYITYATKNRFTYLGNGFSQTHLQLESDLTY
ncbi:hypothetical protein G4B11_000259 [Aspergillus flavus]|nr:hypothetical protein G4B11_000259 [Aspergillus flavus]